VPGAWRAMARPARRLRAGLVLQVADAPAGAGAPALVVLGRDDEGFVTVAAGDPDAGADGAGADGATADALVELAGRWGHMPLPPYIRREAAGDAREASDRERYQTVFAADGPGAARSVAAPTAGLHFTPAVLAALADRGVATARVRLHVGPGTFQPPSPEQIAARRLHAEAFTLPAATAAAVAATRATGGRVVAVGTTALRVLETAARLPLPDVAADGTNWPSDWTTWHSDGTNGPADGTTRPAGDADSQAGAAGDGGFFTGSARRVGGHWDLAGATRLFIAPPDRVTAADGLLTNFHLPGSSLLMLVAALAGEPAWRGIYREAVARRLRFYSYGDCMLLLPGADAGSAGTDEA